MLLLETFNFVENIYLFFSFFFKKKHVNKNVHVFLSLNIAYLNKCRLHSFMVVLENINSLSLIRTLLRKYPFTNVLTEIRILRMMLKTLWLLINFILYHSCVCEHFHVNNIYPFSRHKNSLNKKIFYLGNRNVIYEIK